MDNNAAVIPWAEGDPDRPVNGHRQYKAIVVIGVFADQVDAPGGTDDVRWRSLETVLEFGGDEFL